VYPQRWIIAILPSDRRRRPHIVRWPAWSSREYCSGFGNVVHALRCSGIRRSSGRGLEHPGPLGAARRESPAPNVDDMNRRDFSGRPVENAQGRQIRSRRFHPGAPSRRRRSRTPAGSVPHPRLGARDDPPRRRPPRPSGGRSRMRNAGAMRRCTSPSRPSTAAGSSAQR
jgi:hypothetical protein